MSWYLGGPNLASITALLDQPDTTVEQVLNDSALNAALRNGMESLLSFFFDDDAHLTKLLDIALTDYIPVNSTLPAKTTRTAVQVLTMANSNKIMDKLKDNPLFLQRIIDFPKSGFATNTRNCGHFGRIIESFARATSGDFLKKITTLKDFLEKQMINLGLRELFVTLITEFPSSYGISPDYFIEITKNPPELTMFYIVSGINSAIQSKKEFIREVENVNFLKNVLDIAIRAETTQSHVTIEAFLLAERIISHDPSNSKIQDVVHEESEVFDFSKDRTAPVLSAALKVLFTHEDKVLLKILEKGNSTFMNDGIVRSLEYLSDDQLKQFNERTQFATKVMETFASTKANSHLSSVAKVLNRILSSDSEWAKFFEEQVKPRDEQRKSSYGGDRPQILRDSDTSSDDFGEQQYNGNEEDLFGSQSSSDDDTLSSESSDDYTDSDTLSDTLSDYSSEDLSDDDSDEEHDEHEEHEEHENHHHHHSNEEEEHHSRPVKLHKFGSIPLIEPIRTSDNEEQDSSDNEQVEMLKAPPLNIDLHIPILQMDDDNDLPMLDQLPPAPGKPKFDPNMNFDSDGEHSNSGEETNSTEESNSQDNHENSTQQSNEQSNEPSTEQSAEQNSTEQSNEQSNEPSTEQSAEQNSTEQSTEQSNEQNTSEQNSTEQSNENSVEQPADKEVEEPKAEQAVVEAPVEQKEEVPQIQEEQNQEAKPDASNAENPQEGAVAEGESQN